MRSAHNSSCRSIYPRSFSACSNFSIRYLWAVMRPLIADSNALNNTISCRVISCFSPPTTISIGYCLKLWTSAKSRSATFGGRPFGLPLLPFVQRPFASRPLPRSILFLVNRQTSYFFENQSATAPIAANLIVGDDPTHSHQPEGNFRENLGDRWRRARSRARASIVAVELRSPRGRPEWSYLRRLLGTGPVPNLNCPCYWHDVGLIRRCFVPISRLLIAWANFLYVTDIPAESAGEPDQMGSKCQITGHNRQFCRDGFARDSLHRQIFITLKKPVFLGFYEDSPAGNHIR